MNATEYRKQQSQHVAKARSIHDQAQKEGRDLTDQETLEFNNEMASSDKCGINAAQIDKLETLESSLKESAGRISRPEPIHNEIQRYSLVRAMRSMAEKGHLDGIEAEISAEIAKKTGEAPEGFYMPLDLPVERYANLDTSTGAGGLNTTVDYSNFIELLRKRMLLNQLGARILSDLNGTVQIPKQTGGATAYWIAADGTPTITLSAQGLGQVPLVPTTVGASTNYTRAFLKQTSLDVENFVRNDLATVIAIEMDRVGFYGSGSGAEPKGVGQNSSVTTVPLATDGDDPSFASMVAMETAVAAANADLGALAYVTTPAARGKMKVTEIAENTARFIWENNQINGYSAYATNQLPSNLTKGTGTALSAALFGNWNDLLIGLWGGLDVVVNPYSGDTAGSVKITMMQDCQIALRHTESFARMLDIVTV